MTPPPGHPLGQKHFRLVQCSVGIGIATDGWTRSSQAGTGFAAMASSGLSTQWLGEAAAAAGSLAGQPEIPTGRGCITSINKPSSSRPSSSAARALSLSNSNGRTRGIRNQRLHGMYARREVVVIDCTGVKRRALEFCRHSP